MAIPRQTADTAYLQTDYSALLELYKQRPAVDIEVALGTRCAIVRPPSGQPDKARLQECTTFATVWSGEHPAVIDLSPRVENVLTRAELCDLEAGFPVLVHVSKKRHLVPAEQARPTQTPLTNRINDARQLMVAESLLHLGHLSAKDPTSVKGKSAFDAVANHYVENDWPAEIKTPATDDERYAYLEKNYKEGKHSRIGNKFYPNGVGTIDRIAEHYTKRSYTASERRERTRYWKTILRSAIAVDGIAEKQHAAFQQMVKTPEGQLFAKRDIMDFIGASGRRPNFDTVLPVALYRVEDIGDVMMWVSIGKEFYRCAAIVGEIARGGRARISPIQARFLNSVLSEPVDNTATGCMEYSELLRHEMMQHQTLDWWEQALSSPRFDNDGFRFVCLDDLQAKAPISPTNLNDQARIEDFLSKRGYDILKHASKARCRIALRDMQTAQLYYREDVGAFSVFLSAHRRWGEECREWFEDSITRCVAQVLIERAEGRIVDLRKTNPFVWEDTISIATATKTIIEAFGGKPLAVHDIDIAACSLQLSDQEVEQAIELGALVADEFIRAP